MRLLILAASLLLASCANGPQRSDEPGFSDPGSVAQAWWEALASDDVDVAMSFLHPNGAHTRDALSKSHPPIAGVRVTDVEIKGNGHVAEVAVAFLQHGVEQRTSTLLVLEDDRWWVEF